MKLAIVADLHGNLPATEAMDAALKEIGPDEIWFLGDAVGKGPSSAATCDWVQEHCTRCIGGNWDYGIGGKEFPADDYFWQQLGAERMRWLNSLPREGELWMSGVRFRLFHGRPVTELMHAATDEAVLQSCLRTENGTFGGVIFADSHRPFFRTLQGGYIMNTGSVGNSLGVTMAHGLLLEGRRDDHEKSLLRTTILSVPYDVEAAIRDADPDLPHRAEYIRELRTGCYARGGKTV